MAVANVGGRKGVLSRLDLVELMDAHGTTVNLTELPLPLGVQLFRQTLTHKVEHGLADQVHSVVTEGPPLILAPDDVVTLRFRARRGIEWSERWTLEKLRGWVESLDQPISMAKIRAIYRRGRHVVTEYYTVSVQTKKQSEYVLRLRALTQNLTVRPPIDPQVVDFE